MAFTFKSKRQGYDNISIGNATGLENAVAPGVGVGETTRLTLSQRGTSTSALSQGMPEQYVGIGGGASSDLNSPAQSPVPTSDGVGDTSPAWASATSNTSAFPEKLG